jgi:hypothetical protein
MECAEIAAFVAPAACDGSDGSGRSDLTEVETGLVDSGRAALHFPRQDYFEEM